MYEELVKKIRRCATDPMHCLSCGEDKDGRCFKRLMTQAADAIEELQKRVPPVPHGRLIDADAFAAEMKKRQDACAEWRDAIKNGGGYGTELYYRADSFLGAMCETKLTLDKIPTIIPAEEGE